MAIYLKLYMCPCHEPLVVQILLNTSATLARSIREVGRMEQPLCSCLILILGTSCLAGKKIFYFERIFTF